MKPVIAIFLFTCLTAPFLGAYLWLGGEIKSAKKEARSHIKDKIKSEDQILFKFTSYESITKLKWEHSREFEFKGEMYDIIRFQTKGDSVWYWCYHDKKETNLKKGLTKLLAGHPDSNPLHQPHQKRFLDFLKTLYCLSDAATTFQVDMSRKSKVIATYTPAHADVWLDPIFPPPRQI